MCFYNANDNLKFRDILCYGLSEGVVRESDYVYVDGRSGNMEQVGVRVKQAEYSENGDISTMRQL